MTGEIQSQHQSDSRCGHTAMKGYVHLRISLSRNVHIHATVLQQKTLLGPTFVNLFLHIISLFFTKVSLDCVKITKGGLFFNVHHTEMMNHCNVQNGLPIEVI